MLNLAPKDLDVWNKCKKLTTIIYKITSQFPKEERYNLISQMRRSAISISSNIAEGMSRKSIAEKKRFLEISRSSLIELDSQIEICAELGYLSTEDSSNLDDVMNHIFAMLTNLIAKVR